MAKKVELTGVERRKAECAASFLKMKFNRGYDCTPSQIKSADAFEIARGTSPAVVAQFRYSGTAKDKHVLAQVVHADMLVAA